MKSNKKSFVTFWIIAICLAVFYLGVLVLGMKPKVGTEYRMYYITHELSDWPGYGKLSYTLGTTEYCTELKDRNGKVFSQGKVCQRKGQGFLEKQYDGSESTGDASYIYYIPDESSETAEYVFEINGFDGAGDVTVYANDTQIGKFDETGRYSMYIGKVDKDELLTIKYVTNNCSFRLWTTGVI